MDNETRYNLITRGLQEVIGGEIVQQILAEGRTPKCYWGTAPTGRPHIAYFVALLKIADFLQAGVEVTVLLADVHAFLDNLKAPLDRVANRTQYYKHLLVSIFNSLDIPVERLKFVIGSDYQLSENYAKDCLRLAALTSQRDAKKAGAEVVKQVASPLLSSLVYPGLQALDEEYLDCDFQFGGVDQRKIFVYAELLLPRLGYKKRAHMMNPMVSGLGGGKMSSSDPHSKIDFLDSAESVTTKVHMAACEDGVTEGNGLLQITKHILMPLSTLKSDPAFEHPRPNPLISPNAPTGTLLSIMVSSTGNAPVERHYSSIEELEKDFGERKLTAAELKDSVSDALNKLLDPIREAFDVNQEWREITKLAYPGSA